MLLLLLVWEAFCLLLVVDCITISCLLSSKNHDTIIKVVLKVILFLKWHIQAKILFALFFAKRSTILIIYRTRIDHVTLH